MDFIGERKRRGAASIRVTAPPLLELQGGSPPPSLAAWQDRRSRQALGALSSSLSGFFFFKKKERKANDVQRAKEVAFLSLPSCSRQQQQLEAAGQHVPV